MPQPTSHASWNELVKLAARSHRISDLFERDSARAEHFCAEQGGLRLDYSKTLIDEAVRGQLIQLAEDCGLAGAMQAMRSAEHINRTEDRAVLHIALRDVEAALASDYGDEVHRLVSGQLARIETLSTQIRSGEWRGHTGKRIKHLVNIGIGGSDLGPKMVCEALRDQQHAALQVHFASNVDDTHLPHILRDCDPEETLFSISSKTFTTQETMCNARLARQWLLDHYATETAIAKHCIAVTTNTEAAVAFGIAEQNLLSFWDWVGGRFSLWSSIGFPIAAALGYPQFAELLAGAHSMDAHFFSADFDRNLPVLLGLCGIWHNNFCAQHSLGVIPYNDALSLLPMYLQQLDMESNGKSIDIDGEPVDYATGPIVWGQNGSNGQHAFFQLLHQGTSTVPLEFIVALNPNSAHPEQHRILLSNLLAQANAFMCGEPAETGKPYTDYPGNKPSLCIALDQLNAFNLGALIALYEHKIFVQGVIWNLNSFDQWGVQLGKRLANEIGTDFSAPPATLDASTRALMAWADRKLSESS